MSGPVASRFLTGILKALGGVSWSSGTQVPAVTSGTAGSLLTVGTASGNLIQAGASGLPAIGGSLVTGLVESQLEAADSWDHTWDATTNGSPANSGWTVDSGNTQQIATLAGQECWQISGSAAANGRVYRTLGTPWTGAYEWEVLMYQASPASGSGAGYFRADHGMSSPYILSHTMTDTAGLYSLSGSPAVSFQISGTGSLPALSGTWFWLRSRAIIVAASPTASQILGQYYVAIPGGKYLLVGSCRHNQLTSGGTQGYLAYGRTPSFAATCGWATVRYRAGVNARRIEFIAPTR